MTWSEWLLSERRRKCIASPTLGSAPTHRFGDYTVVHGHQPTPYIKKDWQDLHGYDPETEFPCLKFETDESFEIRFKATYRGYAYNAGADPITVNVDTGAVFGHRLSAVGFGESWSTDGRLDVIQVAVARGYRRGQETTLSWLYFGG